MGPARTQRLVRKASDATSPLPNVLHPQDVKRKSLRNHGFPPSTLTFPRLSSKDSETHADVDLTHVLLNPTPTSPLKTLGNKQTSALRKLTEIFTNASTQK